MNFTYFVCGIMAVAALGFTATTACSEDDIKACETSLQILKTHKNETKILTHECETIRRIVECLQRTSRNCSSSMKQTMISRIAGYKQAEKTCQHLALVTEKRILIRNKRWFGKDIIKGAKKGLSKVKDAAETVGEKISGKADKVKQTLKKKKKLVSKFKAKVKPVLKKYKHKVLTGLRKTGKKMAKKFGKKLLSCASIGVATCAGNVLAMAKDVKLTYTSILCWKLKGAYSCLDSALNECRGHWDGLRVAEDAARRALGTAFDVSQCNGIEPEPVIDAQKDVGSCTFEKLYDCEGKMVKSPYVDKAHCGAMASVQQCFSDAQRDCKSKLMMSEIQEYKGIIDEYAITCVNDGIVNSPSVIMSLLTCAVLTVVKNVF